MNCSYSQQIDGGENFGVVLCVERGFDIKPHHFLVSK